MFSEMYEKAGLGRLFSVFHRSQYELYILY